MAAVVRRRAINAEPDFHAGIRHLAHRRNPAGKPHVGTGAVRHAGAGAGEQIDLAGIELHAVRMPDIISGPANRLDILARPHAELRQAVIDILDILRQMRVQPDAKASRHLGTVAHQVHRHRKGRAWRQRHPLHRVTRRVMQRLDSPLAILKDVILVPAQYVRRQPAA